MDEPVLRVALHCTVIILSNVVRFYFSFSFFIFIYLCLLHSHCSLVSIITRLRDRQSGFDSRQELGLFLLSTASRPALGPTQLPIQRVPEIQRPGREADLSPQPSAKDMNSWSYISTPPVRLHGMVLN
jgi:hypothetical protein